MSTMTALYHGGSFGVGGAALASASLMLDEDAFSPGTDSGDAIGSYPAADVFEIRPLEIELPGARTGVEKLWAASTAATGGGSSDAIRGSGSAGGIGGGSGGRRISRRNLLQILALLAVSRVSEGRSEPEPYRQQMQRLLPLKWREVAAQFEGREYAVLGNLRAFSLLGEALAKSENGKKFLFGKSELTILYPGAGVHLSPVEFIMRLAQNAPHLDRVRLIYTEICKDCFERIDKDLRAVVGGLRGLSDLSVETKENCNPGKEKIMRFTCTTPSGTPVKVELLFAFERGNEDGAYYRHEYFQSADILLSHDSIGDEGFLSPGHAVNMFAGSIAKEGGRDKPRLLLIEHGEELRFRRILYSALGGFETIDAPYGCGNNHLDKKGMLRESMYDRAAIIYLDTELFMELAGKDPELVRAYSRLLTFTNTKLSEHGVLEGAEARLKEAYDGYKTAVNKDFAAILRALPGLGEATRKKLSLVLSTLFAGNFNFGILDDSALQSELHLVVRDYLGVHPAYDINKEMSGYFNRRQRRFSMFAARIREILFCYIVASRAGDSESLDQLKEVVGKAMGELGKGKMAGVPRFPSRNPAAVAFERDGLFVFWRNSGLDMMFLDFAAVLMTLLYLAKRFNCEGQDGLEQFLTQEMGVIIPDSIRNNTIDR